MRSKSGVIPPLQQIMKDIKRLLPGAIISILLIAAIVYFVDIPKMFAAIRSADYRFIALSFVLSFVWLWMRAIVWRTLLRERASFRDVFNTLNEGYLLNILLPFRLGEIGRAFLLSRKSDLQFAEVLPTIIIERAIDLAFTAAIFLGALPFVVGVSGADRIAIVLGIVVVAGLVFLFILARNDAWALDTFHKLSGRWPKLQQFGGNLLESFLVGLAVLTDGWLFARFLFWMTLNWGLAIFTYYLTIRAFFPQTQLIWGMFVLGAGAFGNAIPSLPGAVGTFEGALGGALTLLTHDQSTSLAAALTSHFFNYLTAIVLGGYALSREGHTLSGIYQQLINLRTKKEE
jgi:uncharacterized protein (TIRG00374 family)